MSRTEDNAALARERLVSLYADDATHTSPKIRARLPGLRYEYLRHSPADPPMPVAEALRVYHG
jgi:hypothetical protein